MFREQRYYKQFDFDPGAARVLIDRRRSVHFDFGRRAIVLGRAERGAHRLLTEAFPDRPVRDPFGLSVRSVFVAVTKTRCRYVHPTRCRDARTPVFFLPPRRLPRDITVDGRDAVLARVQKIYPRLWFPIEEHIVR